MLDFFGGYSSQGSPGKNELYDRYLKVNISQVKGKSFKGAHALPLL